MIVESDYAGFEIEATAVRVAGGWDAEVRIRQLSEAKAWLARLVCRKPTAKVAELRAVIHARRWIDRRPAPA
jgi:hypothetical protein